MPPEDILKKLHVTDINYDTNSIKYNPIEMSWMVLTYYCNSKCNWCYAKDMVNLKHSHIPFKLAKKIIKLLSIIGIKELNLIGGEPTLYPHFFDIIKFCNECGIMVSITTNGRRLSDLKFVDKLIKSNIREIVISIECHKPEIHDKITNSKSSFEQTFNGIQNCMDVCLPFKLNTVVSKSNKNHLMEFLTFFDNMGIKRIDLDICNPSIYGHWEEILSPIQYVNIFSDIIRHSIDLNISIGFDNIGPFCLYDDEIIHLLKNNCFFSGNSCDIIAPHMIIDNRGYLLPCCQFVDLPFGTLIKNDDEIVTQEEFLNVWESDRIKTFRKEIFRYPTQKCITCSNWNYCIGGGCPLTWLLFNPNDYII